MQSKLFASSRSFLQPKYLSLLKQSSFATNRFQPLPHKAIRTAEEAAYNRMPTEFMEEPHAIARRRRLQGKYFEMELEKKKDYEIFIESYTDTVIEFDLFMDHLSYDCQRIDALMNYYQISYKRNQNIVFLQGFKNNYSDEYFKNTEIKWPILRVYLSLEPVKFIMGAKEIENYLMKNNFIITPKHATNSAWAKQGEEFVKKVIEPQLEILFLNPILTYQNVFKSAPETYTLSAKTFILIRAFRLNFALIFKSIAKNLRKLRKEPQYKDIREKILESFSQWEQRLNGQEYHGGESPDEADFALYAVIKAKYNSMSFQKFIENKIPRKVFSWFIRMQVNCKYEKNRFLVQ